MICIVIKINIEKAKCFYCFANTIWWLIMPLFITLLALTVSSTFLGSDRTLWARTVIASPEIAFLLLWKINHFVSGVPVPAMHLYLPLSQIFKIPLYNKDYHKILPYWVQYTFVLAQMIFAFAEQNQWHLVLSLMKCRCLC